MKSVDVTDRTQKIKRIAFEVRDFVAITFQEERLSAGEAELVIAVVFAKLLNATKSDLEESLETVRRGYVAPEG